MAINDLFMLPRRVRTMEQMYDLLNTEQEELALTSHVIAALMSQLVISTSTFLLPRHEKIFALPTNAEESLAVRRARMLARLNTQGSTTVKALKELIRIVTGCETGVVEHFSDNNFTVIVHLLLSDNANCLQELIRRIDEIKPAHLTFDTLGAVHPIPLYNQNELYIYRLTMRLRVDNVGKSGAFLDGQRTLDGTWLLWQVLQGMELRQIKISLLAAVERNWISGTLTTDSMWRLDGGSPLDGGLKLNAAIRKEEI